MTREEFTLTPDEFDRLDGGQRRVPAVAYDSALIWQEVAERLGLRLLSIHWPDPTIPDFTAERSES